MTVRTSPLTPPAHPPRRARRRLPPEARIPLILDAALAAFSAQGYADTRIDDIAQQAGLSKGGLYAHFDSKEAIFHALLQRSMQLPTLDVDAMLVGADTAQVLAQRLLQPMYQAVQSPSLVALSRILLTEGHRLPPLAQAWRHSVHASLCAQVAQVLHHGVAQGLLRPTVLTAVPGLVLSPLVHWMVQHISGGPQDWADADQAYRTHVQLLIEQLKPFGNGEELTDSPTMRLPNDASQV